MSDGVRICLLGAPRGKGRPRHTRAGIIYTPAETRAFESSLRHEAALAMRGRAPLEGPLAVQIDAWMPIPASWSPRKQMRASMGMIRPTTAPDADNLLKTIDALNKIVWRDDAQIVCVSVVKRYSERPRLEIEVARIDAAAAQARVGRARKVSKLEAVA